MGEKDELKTHDLDELGCECESIEPSLKPTLTEARDLTVFAWEFRYPGDTEIPIEDETKKAHALARAVSDEILSSLRAFVPSHPFYFCK